uniref:hypothetical protein n=1 Tax=Streptosporangium roseum TaxID=2001 RepID=UPI0018CC170B
EPLFVREDGRPFDRWRMTTALRRAATAAGVDHASPVTTQRYNRGRRKLDSHAVYRMASILGGGA